MKWYNVEVDRGIEDKSLKYFLLKNSIKFESSEAYNLIHFEILASESDLAKVDAFLEGWR